jgi:dihydrofolate reductase
MGDSIIYRLSTYGLLLSAGGWTLTINQNEIEIDSLPPVTSIVATAANYVEKKGYPIGRNNDIPWRCLDDLGNFKAVTEHNAIVMGSGTFESLVFKPLKNRLHLVLTRKPSAMLEKYKHLDLTNVVFVLDQRRRDKEPGWPIKRAIRNAHELLGYRKVLVIGGGQIYRYLEPLTTSMHWTKVNCVVEDADTFYSPSDEFIPRGVAYLEQEQDDRNDHSFKVYRYFKPKQMD